LKDLYENGIDFSNDPKNENGEAQLDDDDDEGEIDL
jgi:hypothetical protein